MGYRSNIYIKCKKEKVFEFKHFLSSYKEKFNEDLQQTEDFYTDSNYLYLTLSDWKFYDSFPEVGFIIDFVNQMEEGNIGMIAIGEDSATDQWGSPWGVDLNVYMRIEGM